MKFSNKILLVVGVTGVVSTLAGIAISSHKISNEGEVLLVEKSEAILSQLEYARTYVAEQGGLKNTVTRLRDLHRDGNIPKEEKLEVLKQVPIYAAMEIGRKSSEKEHYSFRVFSLHPRNKENLATASETEILKRFEVNSKLEEISDAEGDNVTVYRPVRLSEAQGCLVCHGHPSKSPWGNGKDILGYTMENWSDGYLHGVFAITSSKKPIQEAATNATMTIAFWGFVASVFAIIGSFLIIRPSLKSLQDIVDALSGAGNQVSSASHEISISAINLSDTSSRAAAHIEQTSASTEEINSMILRNSEFSDKAKHLASDAVGKAQEGQQVVTSLKSSIEEISQSSKKISDIITMIDDIAFQTNLLALNAAVEAARAGEQGKGFAVVAEAVRSLAQRSASSAKEISDLIKDSVEKVEQGHKKANSSEESLNEIVKSVNDLSVINSEIASSSHEQSQGIKQISHAIQDLDQLTQSNAAAAEEAAAASEELSAQSIVMNDVVLKLVEVLEGAVTASASPPETNKKNEQTPIKESARKNISKQKTAA